MAQMDKKQRTIIVGIVIATCIIIAGIGIAVWLLAGNNEEPEIPNTPFENVTPGEATIQQVGSVSIAPETIALTTGPNGSITGSATVTALFKDFYLTSIEFEGGAGLAQSNTCPQGIEPLRAGESCEVTIGFTPPTTGADTSSIPTMVVLGRTSTPGGSEIVAEARAPVQGTAPGEAQFAQAPQSFDAFGNPIPNNGSPLNQGAAPNSIDPYGPVAPQQASAPPVDYNQPPAEQPQRPAAKPLTAREQFILARRQGVLENITYRNPQTQRTVSATTAGGWDELGIQKATSSLPQDMSRVVTMDRIITAVLARPYDSRQAQQVVAIVDRNVYSGQGRTILIPRGSSVIGQMVGTNERAAVIWTQIIRPDGARFVFQGSGGDAMGQAGVPGKVNNRYLKRFGAAFLGTILKVGTAVATNASEEASGGFNGPGGQGVGSVARNNGAIITDIVTRDINAALAPIIQQAQQIQPIVTVPAGTRMTIVPNMDLVMHPVQRQTIIRPSYPRQMNGGSGPAPSQNGPTPIDMSQSQYGQGPSVSQQERQQAIGRTLSSTPAGPGATPPWGSN